MAPSAPPQTGPRPGREQRRDRGRPPGGAADSALAPRPPPAETGRDERWLVGDGGWLAGDGDSWYGMGKAGMGWGMSGTGWEWLVGDGDGWYGMGMGGTGWGMASGECLVQDGV